MQVTVLGTGTARPAAGTATSGLLVRSGSTAVLLDCGTGIAARLVGHLPADALSGIVLTHLHADHALDLAALRYRFPWAGGPERRIPVHVPVGGSAVIAAMSVAVAERAGFIEEAFDLREFVPPDRLVIGELALELRPAQHYVPAASVAVRDKAGLCVVYAGDTGPTAAVVDFAHRADLLIIEATLATPEEDDDVRGHLTGDEAIAVARRSEARRTLLVHYPPERREVLAAACRRSSLPIDVAFEGMTVHVGGAVRRGRSNPGHARGACRAAWMLSQRR